MQPSLFSASQLKNALYLGHYLLYPHRLLFKRSLPKRPGRILILCTDFIGDFLMTTPAIRALRVGFPDAEISLVATRNNRDLVRGFPHADRIIFVEPFFRARSGWTGKLQAFRDNLSLLREQVYDLAVEFTALLSNQLYLPFIRARYLIGRDTTGHNLRLDRRIDERREFRAAKNLRLVGLVCPQPPRQYPLWNPLDVEPKLHQQICARLETLLQQTGLARKAIAVLHVGAAWQPKRWPLERYARLADHLCDRHQLHVVFVGGPGDRPEIAALIAQMRHSERTSNLAGQTDLKLTAALIARARLFVGNDSGPSHIAAAVGAPSLVFFSNSDPVEWGNPGQTILRRAIPCSPCKQSELSQTCTRGFSTCEGLQQIGADEVALAATRLLAAQPAHEET